MKFQFFWFVSVAEETGLKFVMSKNLEDRFSRDEVHLIFHMNCLPADNSHEISSHKFSETEEE